MRNMGAPVKKEEAPLELESQMILRLPEVCQTQLQKSRISGISQHTTIGF